MRYTLLFYLFLSLVCCEPDDICSQSTQTTPRLVIDFYDIENLSDKKSVAGLFAIGINEQGDEINIIGESVETRIVNRILNYTKTIILLTELYREILI